MIHSVFAPSSAAFARSASAFAAAFSAFVRPWAARFSAARADLSAFALALRALFRLCAVAVMAFTLPVLAAAQERATDPLAEDITKLRREAAQRAMTVERHTKEGESFPERPAFPTLPDGPAFPPAPWESDAPKSVSDHAKDPSVNLLNLLLRPVTVDGKPKEEPKVETPDLRRPGVIAPRAPATPTGPGIASAPSKPLTPAQVEARKKRFGGNGRTQIIPIAPTGAAGLDGGGDLR